MFKAPTNRSFTPKRIITSHDVDKYVQKEEEKTQSPFQVIFRVKQSSNRGNYLRHRVVHAILEIFTNTDSKIF